MRKKIKEYIKNCITCLMANASPNRFEGDLRSEYSPKDPFEIIHIDHFGPLQETDKKYKYVFEIINAFSRYTWFFPTKTTNTREVCDCLTFLFNCFGRPKVIVADRGSAFTSKDFTTFLDNLKINLRKVAVASPWANGMIERVNRFLKTSLTKLVVSAEDWINQLDTAQYVLNNTFNSAIKASPSRLLLGYDQHRHSDKQLKDFFDCFLRNENNLVEQRDTLRNIASEANKKLREYNKIYYDKKHKKPTVYETGDLVLIRDLQPKIVVNKKLKPNYKGEII